MYQPSLPFLAASSSKDFKVLASISSVSIKILPDKVDFPASTCPMNTMFKGCFTVSNSKYLSSYPLCALISFSLN